jgi:hypothetical protein
VKGWFHETVPLCVELERKGIALLRLDGDRYRSTMTCLEALAPLVSEEGTIIVDDYYARDTCTTTCRATTSPGGFARPPREPAW